MDEQALQESFIKHQLEEYQKHLIWSEYIFNEFGSFPTKEELGLSEDNPISDLWHGARWVLTNEGELVLADCLVAGLTAERHLEVQQLQVGVLQ